MPVVWRMTLWCLEHPWMTFFVACALADSLRVGWVVANIRRRREDEK